MSASANDKFLLTGVPGTATNLAAPGYSIGDASINVTSTSDFPTTTGVIFGIDVAELVNGQEVRMDGSYCVFAGVVTGSTTIGSLELLYGDPQNYAAGALTRVYITISTYHNQRLIEGILAHANQDGTLKANSVTNTTIIAGANIATAKLADDAGITAAKLGTAAVTAPKIDWASTGAGGGIWYEELGRVTLGTAGDVLTVSSIPARNHLKVIVFIKSVNATNATMTFNGDTGTNYGFQYQVTNATSVTAGTGVSGAGFNGVFPIDGSNNDNIFGRYEIVNYSTQHKLISGDLQLVGTSASNADPVLKMWGHWVNNTQINSITLTNPRTGDFGIGSQMIVLGHN